MNVNLNNVFFVIPKEKEYVNDPMRFKLDNIIDFNTWEILLYITYDKHKSRTNTVLRSLMEEYGLLVENDLVLKVPFKQKCRGEYAYSSYHPYSMQQAHFLFNFGTSSELLQKLYCFTIDEISQGFAIRKNLKEEFYPSLMEKDKDGYFYFCSSQTGLPEFISLEGIGHIKAKGGL